jgi:hypothetical protein
VIYTAHGSSRMVTPGTRVGLASTQPCVRPPATESHAVRARRTVPTVRCWPVPRSGRVAAPWPRGRDAPRRGWRPGPGFGAQSAVTIGSQALPLTGVVDQLQLNVAPGQLCPNGTKTAFRWRPGGHALAVPRPQSLRPGNDDQLDAFESLAPPSLFVSAPVPEPGSRSGPLSSTRTVRERLGAHRCSDQRGLGFSES